MRSRNLLVALVVCMALIPVACGDDEEAAPAAVPCDLDGATCRYLEGKDFSGQTLTVGVWGGDIEVLLRDMVIPVLEARGAKVELLLGGGGDRLAKIYAEAGDPTMDVAYLNIHTGRLAMQDGVVEAASDEIPAYSQLYPVAREAGVYGMSVFGVGILYNTDLFDGPPEWADLWLPEHNGRIAFPTFPSTGGDTLIAVAARLEGGDEHDPDLAINKIAELGDVPLVYTSLDELGTLLDRGEVHAAPNLSAYSFTLVDNFDNIGFSFPTDPGPVLGMDTVVITEGTPNRELALAWVQVVLSPSTQLAYAERLYFGPTNSTVGVSAELAERVVYGQEAVEALVSLDWGYVAESRSGLTERWNKEILGG
jgi:putative spermidine/putrescine transport system substrate-binding protein